MVQADQFVELRLGRFAGPKPVDGGRAQLGDAREIKGPVQESVHGHVIRGNERGARTRSLAAGGTTDGQGRKALAVDWFE